ncbi:MAG: hypothetical protein ACLGJC_09410 [Alphaproteobacteria bacterium]
MTAKPAWDRLKVLRVALSNGGRFVVSRRYRDDQVRALCWNANQSGHMQALPFRRPGEITFQITDAGKQWLRDNSPKKD